jgi:DNA-binding MarR family transcriptional regulator
MSREKRILEIIDLLRGNQVLTDLLDQTAADYLGINRTDASALDVIDRYGRITAGDLARELRLTTGAVTTVVDRLEHAGFARRVADPDDRRRVLIEITPVVTENAERIYGKPEDGISMWNGFTDEEITTVRRFQEMSRKWIEGRLAHLDELAFERPPRVTVGKRDKATGKKRLSGRGRA